MLTPFHLAFNVTDLSEARKFYCDLLGCEEGRSTESWIDFNFFGHQLSLHLGQPFESKATGHVGEHMVLMPHFGVILQMPEWQSLAEKLTSAKLDFVISPTVRFEGEPGEQANMFFFDPSGNPIEIKGFSNINAVFSS
ncbi:VOC family protein [uncultured Pelagimonas sp.]|uniref:VOC family protein n=1 Tax=uncultured Pelagimonas sp. TaxID=1618102 RepID=UPI0026037830|nr:VOC family protein [uncultured Pelagimonas sp.]